jgi:transcriptional regulator with XRE-family HTH domain
MPFRHLAPVLKQLREESDLTARGVSRLLGKCDAYLHGIEHGRDLPAPDSILRLAALYRTSAKKLFRLARKDMLERVNKRLIDEHQKALKAWADAGMEQAEFKFGEE